MKIAIMQPYLFPYYGYFQLINSVDEFIIYDNVSYRKRSWINRNRITLKDEIYLFTIPIKNASQNIFIKDIQIAMDYKWKKKFMKTLEHAYTNAPFYGIIFNLMDQILDLRFKFLKDIYLKSFEIINKYLSITTRIVEASSIKELDSSLSGQDRILNLCKVKGANHYYNLPNGQNLYSLKNFSSVNVKLEFIKPQLNSFLNSLGNNKDELSIIHNLMYLDKIQLRTMLNEYKFL